MHVGAADQRVLRYSLPDSRHRIGTGTLVADRLALTAAHVIFGSATTRRHVRTNRCPTIYPLPPLRCLSVVPARTSASRRRSISRHPSSVSARRRFQVAPADRRVLAVELQLRPERVSPRHLPACLKRDHPGFRAALGVYLAPELVALPGILRLRQPDRPHMIPSLAVREGLDLF